MSNNKQQGVALAVVLIFIVIMNILVISNTNKVFLQEKMASNQKMVIQAEMAADTAIQDATNKLIAQTINDSGNETSTTWSSSGTVTGLNSSASASYVVNHRITPGGNVAVNSTGDPIYVISATGTVGNVSKNISTVLSFAYTGVEVFQNALTGCDGVDVDSNVNTSSYSSDGNPTSGDNGDISTVNEDADINLDSNTDINGDVNAYRDVIMSNGSIVRKNVNANGDINLHGSGHIYEDATAGGDYYGNSNNVDGTIIENAGTPVVSQECDPLNISGIMDDAENLSFDSHSAYGGQNYSIPSNNTDSFSAGNYEFNGFDTGSNSLITIDGDVVFYIDGDFELKNNSSIKFNSNATLTIYITGEFDLDSNSCMNYISGSCNSGSAVGGASKNLTIYSSAASADSGDYKIDLQSNGDFHGSIYAPNSAININSNAALYGAALGKWIDMDSNTSFSYDEDLADQGVRARGGDVIGTIRYSWQN